MSTLRFFSVQVHILHLFFAFSPCFAWTCILADGYFARQLLYRKLIIADQTLVGIPMDTRYRRCAEQNEMPVSVVVTYKNGD